MDRHLAGYVLAYYSGFMTEKENLAHRHLMATTKATHGRSDSAAQQEVRNSHSHLRKLLSDDPEVWELTRNGAEIFVQRTAERIMAAHSYEIEINRCPRCGEVAKTPKARQCRFCFFDWH
jgi:formylmethanofuran dehydrogenase subunit E